MQKPLKGFYEFGDLNILNSADLALAVVSTTTWRETSDDIRIPDARNVSGPGKRR